MGVPVCFFSVKFPSRCFLGVFSLIRVALKPRHPGRSGICKHAAQLKWVLGNLNAPAGLYITHN